MFWPIETFQTYSTASTQGHLLIGYGYRGRSTSSHRIVRLNLQSPIWEFCSRTARLYSQSLCYQINVVLKFSPPISNSLSEILKGDFRLSGSLGLGQLISPIRPDIQPMGQMVPLTHLAYLLPFYLFSDLIFVSVCPPARSPSDPDTMTITAQESFVSSSVKNGYAASMLE